MKKTNAMRLLDLEKIPYKTKEYIVDENDLSGTHVAKQINMSSNEVFKTLITISDKNLIFVFCIPVNFELNLKKAAKASNNKKLEMVPVKDILKITGYIRGGCSPIGMKKNYPTFIDESAIDLDKIAISAGIRGCQIVINPKQLSNYNNANFSDLIN